MIRLIAILWLVVVSIGARAQDSAPLFAATLTGTDGKPVALADYRGKPLIVNFWARWCAPCRDEMPELRAVAAAQRAHGLVVLGIGLEDNQPAVLDFLKAYEIDYPVLFAKLQGIDLLKAMGNPKAGLPFTVAIDRRGNLVAQKVGRISRSQLDTAAAAALQ